MVFVFFIYGLAFFSMGLAVWLESGRASSFRSARSLRFLAGFGILHGLHEWVEVFTILHVEGFVNLPNPPFVNALDIVVLVLSFIMLVAFGLRMIYEDKGDNGRKRAAVSVIILVAVWAGGTAVSLAYFEPCAESCLNVADVLARYVLGIPGALLAAWAMLLQRSRFLKRGMEQCAQDSQWAALTLFLYGAVGQAFTKETLLYPSTVVNSDLFFQIFGFPVQIFRAAVAVAVTIFIIRALRAFELGRQQQLTAAHDARLAAQQEALATQERAWAETEKLNQKLKTAVQDLTMLFELSRSLAATLDQDALLQKAMTQVFESVPRIVGGMIFLRERAERPLQQMVNVGYDRYDEMVNKTMDRQAQAIGEYVVDAGQPAGWSGDVIISLADLASQSEQTAANTGAFVVGMPLTLQERVAGSLVLSLNPQETPFSQRDLSLINTVASQLSMAIENATLYREVQAREEMRGEMLHQVVAVQETERQRIARELHDGVGQMLTALGFGLAAASESLTQNPERGAIQLAELKTMSAEVLTELQGLIAGLRPSVLDDLGLVPALRGLAQEFETRTKAKARLEVNGRSRRIQPEIETELFRIAQEALTNVAKHAQADAVTIRLTSNRQTVQLTIQDDGCGFVPNAAASTESASRWGLLGMEERAALVHGTCQIRSKSGAGTMVQVDIPVKMDEG
ncbi:MAG: GAF domain-containing sensor histidine kinase [Chloroflexi bacterium]|nr:GAF domain-containing sensor histidine kinase [Chloroflexota bacterium]